MKRKRYVWVVELPAKDGKGFDPAHAFVQRANAVNCWGKYYTTDKARVRRYVRQK